MKNKKYLLLIPILLAITIVGWAPWLTKAKTKEIVTTYTNFQEQHNSKKQTVNPDIYVLPLPFCRWVTTYEGGWFVCFWEKSK